MMGSLKLGYRMFLNDHCVSKRNSFRNILYLVFTLHYCTILSYNWLLGQDCNLAGFSSLPN